MIMAVLVALFRGSLFSDYDYLTMPRLTELGKNRGSVETIVVMKIPKPNPSITCNARHAEMNPQVEGISLVNL